MADIDAPRLTMDPAELLAAQNDKLDSIISLLERLVAAVDRVADAVPGAPGEALPPPQPAVRAVAPSAAKRTAP
jgi:hypothetical protein